MNKRANLYLNIYEFFLFVLSLSCIGLCMILSELTLPVPEIIKIVSLGIGLIATILFISIEAFLFLLMSTKSKLLFLFCIILEIVIAILINIKIPFSAFLVFMVCSFLKNSLRIKLVEKIYIPKEFNRYCKMFNIKVKDFPKKRTVKLKKEKESEKVKTEKKVFATETKKSTKSDKSYA